MADSQCVRWRDCVVIKAKSICYEQKRMLKKELNCEKDDTRSMMMEDCKVKRIASDNLKKVVVRTVRKY